MGELLKPKVESVGYKPLLAEVLTFIGMGKGESAPAQAEDLEEQAFLVAEASGDDVTAVKAASTLIYVVGYEDDRKQEAERWAHVAYALLEKLGSTQPRLRGWVLTNHASVLSQAGDHEAARRLLEEAVRLKAQALGEQHPDVAISLSNLSCVLNSEGNFRDSLAAADRAVAILGAVGDPDSWLGADLLTNRATALTALGRYDEADRDFMEAFRIHPRDNGSVGMQFGDQQHGLGTLRLAQGRAAEAIPMLEDALAIRQRGNADATFTADTRFSLARALWETGKNRRRALSLATAARTTYAKHHRLREETMATTWLAAHTGMH
jgi:tetratricopeptide (TPR) repeat protein